MKVLVRLDDGWAVSLFHVCMVCCRVKILCFAAFPRTPESESRRRSAYSGSVMDEGRITQHRLDDKREDWSRTFSLLAYALVSLY